MWQQKNGSFLIAESRFFFEVVVEGTAKEIAPMSSLTKKEKNKNKPHRNQEFSAENTLQLSFDIIFVKS